MSMSHSDADSSNELYCCERASQLMIAMFAEPEASYMELNRLAEQEGDKWAYAFLMELKFSKLSKHYDPISVPIVGISAGIRNWLTTKLSDPLLRKYAAYILGSSYFYGLGCDPDPEQCWTYLLTSGDEYKYVLALCLIAECYAMGFGIPNPDMNQAFLYNKKAADLGYEGTFLATANCLLYGVGCEVDQSEAVKYFKLASHYSDDEDSTIPDSEYPGNAQAMYFLAACFLEGVGAPVSREKGLTWLKRSAAKGYQTASDIYRELTNEF
jgi:TPR repeat protein